MKNSAIISVVFGLIMLAAFSFQIMDNMIQWSGENESIELSESTDELDEEEATFNLVLLNKATDSDEYELRLKNGLNWNEDINHFLAVLIKIPLPPPERIYRNY